MVRLDFAIVLTDSFCSFKAEPGVDLILADLVVVKISPIREPCFRAVYGELIALRPNRDRDMVHPFEARGIKVLCSELSVGIKGGFSWMVKLSISMPRGYQNYFRIREPHEIRCEMRRSMMRDLDNINVQLAAPVSGTRAVITYDGGSAPKRWMRSRITANNSRGTATSANWNVMYLE